MDIAGFFGGHVGLPAAESYTSLEKVLSRMVASNGVSYEITRSYSDDYDLWNEQCIPCGQSFCVVVDDVSFSFHCKHYDASEIVISLEGVRVGTYLVRNRGFSNVGIFEWAPDVNQTSSLSEYVEQIAQKLIDRHDQRCKQRESQQLARELHDVANHVAGLDRLHQRFG